jgi:cold shock CspA family protein
MGRVISIHEPDLAYGFIEAARGERVFFHKRDCPRGMPEPYSLVEFFVVNDPGKPCRKALKVLQREEAVA